MPNGPQATLLLQFLSFLNPDGIRTGILKFRSEYLSDVLRDIVSNDLTFYETLKTLQQFSLIRRSEVYTIFVHRLIQAVVKDNLTESELYWWRIQLFKLCDAAYPERIRTDEGFTISIFPLCRMVSKQILHPLLVAEICSVPVATLLRRVGWILEVDV
jgi:hypothetical protein